MTPPDHATVTLDQLLALHAAAERATVGAIALVLVLLALVAASLALALRRPRVAAAGLAAAGLLATQVPGPPSLVLGLAVAVPALVAALRAV